MSSIIQNKYNKNKETQEAIKEKVSGEHIRATSEEQKEAHKIIEKISKRFYEQMVDKSVDELSEEITAAVKEECANLDLPLEQQLRIERTVMLTVLGNGPIEEYIQDPKVTDIIVQRYDNIIVERQGEKPRRVEAVFNNEDHLVTIIKRIVQKKNRQINISQPIVDARLDDGSRVNATIPPVSPHGATLTIRKFSNDILTGKALLGLNSLTKEMLFFLERCVAGKINIFVSGGTGAGKTTMLNILSGFIPKNELVITIEDTLELKLQSPNVRSMEVRPSLNDDMMNVDQKMLVKAALRQRPDRIILGETRDGSIVDLISAMSTGHEGSMSTIHANSPENMCDVRIPILYSMNRETNFTEQSIMMQVAEAIQLIVQISRFSDGARRVTHISEVAGIKPDGKIDIRDIFVYDRETKSFRATGYVPEKIINKIMLYGLSVPVERIFHTQV